MDEFVATLNRTIEEHYRVIVPEGTKIERVNGEPVVKDPDRSNVSMDLAVAAHRGLVRLEKL
jgi:hypothetical protein